MGWDGFTDTDTDTRAGFFVVLIVEGRIDRETGPGFLTYVMC